MGASNKQPIATVFYEWTEEYFSQFSSILRGSMAEKSARWLPVAWNLIVAFLMFLIGTTFFITFGIFLCGITFYYGWNEYKGSSTSAIFKSYKMYQGLNVQYDFYDSYVVIADKYGSNKLPYKLFYAIKSSKYGYVLCVSKVSGFFIPKSVASEQLVKLIEEINTTLKRADK